MAKIEEPRDFFDQLDHVFPILRGSVKEECTEKEFMNLVEVLQFLKSAQYVIDIVIHNIEQYIHCCVAPEFWRKFKYTENGQQGFELFNLAVDDLYDHLMKFLPVLKKLEYLRQNKGAGAECPPPSAEDNTDIEARFRLIDWVSTEGSSRVGVGLESGQSWVDLPVSTEPVLHQSYTKVAARLNVTNCTKCQQ